MLSCRPLQQEATEEVHDTDGPLPRQVSPRETISELPELVNSPFAASVGLEPNLDASPAKPSSISKEPKRPHTIVTRPHRHVPVDATLQSSMRLYPDERHAEMLNLSPKVSTPELSELWSSGMASSSNPRHDLAASPIRPSSLSMKQRKPQQNLTTRPVRRDPTNITPQSRTKSFTDELHTGIFSNDPYGDDGDSQAQEHPLRNSSKKRSAPQDHFDPVTRKSRLRAAAAFKYPQLVSTVPPI